MRFSRYGMIAIAIGALSVALTNGCNCGSPPVAIGNASDPCALDDECGEGERCLDGICVAVPDDGGGTQTGNGEGDGGTSPGDDPDAGTGQDGGTGDGSDSGTSDGTDSGTGNDGGTGQDGGTSCENDTDCPAGQQCDDHLCAPDDADGGSGGDECAVDADCQEHLVCEHGSCVPRCGGDDDDDDGGYGGDDGIAPCEDGKAMLCHVPPGNPSNAHAVCVSSHATDAHLAHGDTLGLCP